MKDDQIGNLFRESVSDQMETCVKEMADVSSIYYQRLRDNGIPVAAATAMTTTFITATIGQIRSQKGPQQ